jgi:hypothetical protein
MQSLFWLQTNERQDGIERVKVARVVDRKVKSRKRDDREQMCQGKQGADLDKH